LPDFTPTEELLEKISKQFEVPLDKVKIVENFYSDFANGLKRQYLAHVIRTMEDQIRQLTGNELFRIICYPVDPDSKELGIAGAQYYPGRYFAIYYHPKTKEKQLRIMLAHELGHLFLVELANTQTHNSYDASYMTEPISTVFGIFTILDKNQFYWNKTTPFKHNSPQEVLDDFSQLQNRQNGMLNIS
jgi:hypothetical protein